MDYEEMMRIPQNEEEWIRLYEYLKEGLYRYIYYRVGMNQQDTEDILQTVFLSVIKDVNHYNSARGDLVSWIYGIARNKIVDCHRRQQALSLPVRTPPEIDLQTIEIFSSIDQRSLPEQLLERREIALFLDAALSTLPHRYSYVLTKKYYEKYTMREIAKDLGVTEKAVESLLDRAREALRQGLKSISKETFSMEDYR